MFQKDTAGFAVYEIALITIPGITQADYVLVYKQIKDFWRTTAAYNQPRFVLDKIKSRKADIVYKVSIYDYSIDKSALLNITLKKRRAKSYITINKVSAIINYVN